MILDLPTLTFETRRYQPGGNRLRIRRHVRAAQRKTARRLDGAFSSGHGGRPNPAS